MHIKMINDSSIRKIALTLGVVLVLFVAAKAIAEFKSITYIGKNVAAADVITVYGKGEMITTPDIASFSFSVTEESSTVGAAQKKATDKMNAILEYIKTAGIEDKDVKTSGYNIYPRYEYRGGTIYVPGKQYIAAYVVSQSVDIKVRDLSKAGELLSGIGEYGATNVSGLTFTMDKQDEVTREARDLAIKDARSQAEVLADALGVRLGRIVSFSESSPYQPYPMYYAKAEAMGMGGDGASAPQIPTGENKTTSNVTITYEIK